MTQALAHLWRRLFGEPPPLASDPELMIRILVESLPPAPPYELGQPPRGRRQADEARALSLTAQ